MSSWSSSGGSGTEYARARGGVVSEVVECGGDGDRFEQSMMKLQELRLTFALGRGPRREMKRLKNRSRRRVTTAGLGAQLDICLVCSVCCCRRGRGVHDDAEVDECQEFNNKKTERAC